MEAIWSRPTFMAPRNSRAGDACGSRSASSLMVEAWEIATSLSTPRAPMMNPQSMRPFTDTSGRFTMMDRLSLLPRPRSSLLSMAMVASHAAMTSAKRVPPSADADFQLNPCTINTTSRRIAAPLTTAAEIGEAPNSNIRTVNSTTTTRVMPNPRRARTPRISANPAIAAAIMSPHSSSG